MGTQYLYITTKIGVQYTLILFFVLYCTKHNVQMFHYIRYYIWKYLESHITVHWRHIFWRALAWAERTERLSSFLLYLQMLRSRRRPWGERAERSVLMVLVFGWFVLTAVFVLMFVLVLLFVFLLLLGLLKKATMNKRSLAREVDKITGSTKLLTLKICT